MKSHEQGKTSLVEFFRSIKFTPETSAQHDQKCSTHFADFDQRARTRRQYNNEDAQLIRSAN